MKINLKKIRLKTALAINKGGRLLKRTHFEGTINNKTSHDIG